MAFGIGTLASPPLPRIPFLLRLLHSVCVCSVRLLYKVRTNGVPWVWNSTLKLDMFLSED